MTVSWDCRIYFLSRSFKNVFEISIFEIFKANRMKTLCVLQLHSQDSSCSSVLIRNSDEHLEKINRMKQMINMWHKNPLKIENICFLNGCFNEIIPILLKSRPPLPIFPPKFSAMRPLLFSFFE